MLKVSLGQLTTHKIVHKLLKIKPQSLAEAFSKACEEETNWHAACTITQPRKLDTSTRGVGADNLTALTGQDGHCMAQEEDPLVELSALEHELRLNFTSIT